MKNIDTIRERLALALTGASLIFAGAALGAADEAAEAMKYYQSGNYGRAIPLFQKAEKDHPKETKVHYYLANALLATQDYANAVKEYNTCIKLDPKSDSARYARMALLNFAGDQPVEDKPAADPDEQRHKMEMLSAIKAIKSQADMQTGQSTQMGSAYAGSHRPYNAGYHSHHRGQGWNSQGVFRYPPGYYSPFGGGQGYLSGAHDGRSSSINNSAANLEHLLDDGPTAEGLRLKPQGTNLYVRNYESPKSIFLHPALPKGLTATQDKLIFDGIPSKASSTIGKPSGNK